VREGTALTEALKEQYRGLFDRPWAVGGAAILVAAINVFLFAFDRPWTASDGVRNWGDWILTGLGVVKRSDLIAPWLYSGSLIDIGVIVGGFTAALLGREFAIRIPPFGELVKGGIGGTLMGTGAMLAFGCNIGGFFSATSALSLSGPCMMLGLLAGAFLGLHYLLWETEHRPAWSSGRSWAYIRARPEGSRQPLVGALVLLLVLAAPFVYGRWGYVPQGIFLLFGVAFGFVFQRSRFCLVRAFREPFMTGDGEHTRAAAVAVVLSMLGFAILKFTDLKDKSEWVFASAGIGALLGGTIFGIGMTLAGGCGAGAIWRAGEGQVKLWIAVACFGLSASLSRLILQQTGALGKLGWAIFLPSTLGWGAAIFAIVAVMAAWAAFATWNETSRRFSAV
jgi:uncharacterized protein